MPVFVNRKLAKRGRRRAFQALIARGLEFLGGFAAVLAEQRFDVGTQGHVQRRVAPLVAGVGVGAVCF